MQLRFLCLLAVVGIGFASPARAQEPLLWTARQLEDAEARARSIVDPTFHRGVQRLTDSASLIYRDGPSEAEAHTDRADFIVVREGGGKIVIGGTITRGRSSGPGEIRGEAIEGGKPYTVAAGDSLYIPIGVPHQFLVAPGQHLVTIIVKVVPRE